MSKNNFKSHSRKWKLILVVIALSTVGTFAPPLISSWIFKNSPLVVISGTEYVSVLTLAVSAYFGANVLQKHITKGNQKDNENGEA